MHIVQLKIDNNIFDNVMFFLNSLKIKGLEISEKSTIEDKNSKLEAFYNGAGCVDGLFKDKSIQSIKANMDE